MVGGVVVGEAGPIGAAARHLNRRARGGFRRVGIGNLEAPMEYAFALGLQMQVLGRGAVVGLAELQLDDGQVAGAELHAHETLSVRPGLFNPGIWRIESMMNLCGSEVQVLRMYS
ncbi:hypothetical protein [Solirhodobacter olei]|uniref:hypothetical protein n=1 Tax=Solirhodobacter olei TaxID=2493082 RepID=UPI0013E2C138|nr:hypothetical protein [Solirhodobacter olei]